MTLSRLAERVVYITGRTSLAELSTGLNGFTAGPGTIATSITKQTGSESWTTDELVGKFVKVVGGGGGAQSPKPVFRPILANGATTITVNAVSGLDSTSRIEVVDLQDLAPDEPEGIRIADCGQPVVISGFAFGADITENLLDLSDSHRVTVSGCSFEANTAGPSVLVAGLNAFTMEHCRFTEGADVDIGTTARVTLTGLVADEAGAIVVSDAQRVVCETLTANDGLSSGLRLTRVFSAELEADINDGGATAIYLEDVTNAKMRGTGLVGTGNTGYGVEIQGSTRANFTGATITGLTGDVLFMSSAATWANLSSTNYGMYEEHSSAAFATASYGTALKLGNYNNLGNWTFDGRTYARGYLNQSSNTSVVTFSGSESYDMGANAVLGFLECVCNSASAEVLLPGGAAIAGVQVTILNKGSQSLTVKPPSGGTLDGGASVTIAAGKAKTFMSLNGNGGKDFRTISVLP